MTLDFDGWRASYDEATFADQQDFYDQVHDRYPAQAHYASTRYFEGFLAHIARPVSIIELGGWDGEFAATMLPVHPEITSWRNYEISRKAVAESVCQDSRFEGIALEDWYWELEHAADLFVASHVIEHLRFEDVLKTFDASDVRWMYLSSPLAEEKRDWQGYHGSHILEVGWAELTEELRARDFSFLPHLSHPFARCFER